MTPQEKGDALLGKFYWSITDSPPKQNHRNAARCAIICVEEILNEYRKQEKIFNGDFKEKKYYEQVLEYLKTK